MSTTLPRASAGLANRCRPPSLIESENRGLRVPLGYVPHTLSLESRARVLDAIPWERRGAFLAASWLLMRPREIRAVDLEDYDPERNTLAVFKAFKGPRLDDPIRGVLPTELASTS